MRKNSKKVWKTGWIGEFHTCASVIPEFCDQNRFCQNRGFEERREPKTLHEVKWTGGCQWKDWKVSLAQY